MQGTFCRLEPLDVERHGDDLFDASMAPGAEERFRYLFDWPQDRPGFDGWISKAVASEEPLFFAVIDVST
ncbi:MAG: GNAT family N-acetyltransferase, partial [Burkholderiales bacterium]